ncbi:MAG: riboflavin synthase [Bdellovibrionales bacterium]|nr:riboflavin synthase [Bdellovibrionales bacterium]
MFSGLIQAVSFVLKTKSQENLLKLTLKRPDSFTSLEKGESIAVNGVCLTLVDFDKKSMSFDLAPETLKITGWREEKIKEETLNLERSLSLQSALGGQILTGHVDAKALVKKKEKKGESYFLTVQIPKSFKKFSPVKSYLALNGVSLTVNKVKALELEFCLIPETLKRSNLSKLKKGDLVNFEVDYMSRLIHCFLESQNQDFFSLFRDKRFQVIMLINMLFLILFFFMSL